MYVSYCVTVAPGSRPESRGRAFELAKNLAGWSASRAMTLDYNDGFAVCLERFVMAKMKSLVAVFLCVFLLPGTSKVGFSADVAITSEPLRDRSTTKTSTLFEELPADDTGIDFVQPIDITHPLKAIYVGGYASPGVAIGDVNGDGLPDIFISGGPVGNRLYLQKPGPNGERSLRFEDVTEATGVGGGDAWAAGATLADIDNDGDLDIYVCNYDSANQLFINRTREPSTPQFVESANAYGLDLVDASFVAAFSDYDLDGDLDVFVVGYQYVNPAGRPKDPPVRKVGEKYEVLPEFQKYYGVVKGPDGRQTFTNVGRPDRLLQSNASEAGDKQIRFTDVSEQAGISGLGVGNSALWWDFNSDRLPDLFIGNDFKVADQLYRNNGDGTFTDVIRGSFPHTTWFSMGSEAGDVNNDGLLDLFVSDMAGTTHYRSKVTMGEMNVHREFLRTANPRQYMRNALLVNTGTPRFLEAAYMSGLAKSDWTWAVKLADFDNDGRLDVFISNGATRMFNHSDRNFTDQERVGKTQWSLWEDSPVRNEENMAFRNLGDLKFEEVSGSWGLRKNGMSYAAAVGDLDDDGDLDLVVANVDEPVSVYRNNSPKVDAGVRIKLKGTKSNRFGVGATVRARFGAVQQVRQVSPSMGFLSCNEPSVHFGITAGKVDELTVQWPSGIEQSFSDLPVNQTYTISETGTPSSTKAGYRVSASKLWFLQSRKFPGLLHKENEFDDYERQPLLPYSHSRLGCGVAVGDVNGDSVPDVYHGRAHGAKRAVYVNAGKGTMRVGSVLPDTKYEDMGVLFFDADSDGDNDLYCVSGGVECEPDSELLRDRLYLNDGKGKFTRAVNALPDLRDSGSVVCAADYDRDGDLDLFVGGRVIPGSYPVTPKSRLLVNQSSAQQVAFVDATSIHAEALFESGLVTGAVWSDADADGWIDLLVTHEWGPVKLFRNEPAADGGRVLVDRTREAGLHARLGWWNGIAACDFGSDGDMDYVVTNFGLNTQYKASDKKPELLYYGDFDATGKSHILEAKFEADKCFPRRGLSCSSHAMPFVRDKVKTFHNFGTSTLQDIYSPQKLSSSLQLTANSLESGILINKGGSGQTGCEFAFQPLPRLAQISPAFGVSISDFNADGFPDIFLANNFFAPQLETGRMDSGLSLVLQMDGVDGAGKLRFQALPPSQSGVWISGDSKGTSLVDFNQDGWADVLVALNDGPMQAMESQPHTTNRLFRTKLIGPPGNPDAVGARVTVHFPRDAQRPPQTAEVMAGSGYLSQSTPVLSFGCGTNKPNRVTVRWPDGRRTEHQLRPGQMAVGIPSPK